MRLTKGTNYSIDDFLKSKEFRNSLAHYGLGQYLEENDIIEPDVLKGLTVKAFTLVYFETKRQLFKHLLDLRGRIQANILAQIYRNDSIEEKRLFKSRQ